MLQAVTDWHPADVADAIATLISDTVYDGRGKADRAAAQRFARSTAVRRAVSMRRGSRLDTVRNLNKMPAAIQGLLSAIVIAYEQTASTSDCRRRLSNGNLSSGSRGMKKNGIAKTRFGGLG